MAKRKLTAFEWLLLFGFTPDEAKYVLEKGLPIPERRLTWLKLLYIKDGLTSSKRTIGMSLKGLKRIYGSGLNPTVYSKYSWLVHYRLNFEEPSPPPPENNPRKPTPEQIRKAETETRLLMVKRLARLTSELAYYGKKRRKPS